MINTLLLVLAAYVIGSIPTGYWVGKAKGIDIRKIGSGSTGATNVWRCVGKVEGIFTLIVDLLKGYLPVLFAINLTAQSAQAGIIHWDGARIALTDPTPVAVALATLIGHSKSIFLGFSGGKSAATGLGTMLAMSPAAGGLTFATWIAIVFGSKIVSLASIAASAANVAYMYLFHARIDFIAYSVLGCLYVTARHKANIQRMIAGTEPKIGDKPKESKGESDAKQ